MQKRYFQEHQLSAFFLIAQINSDSAILGMTLLERSKITVWEEHLSKKRKNSYWNFYFESALRKNVFWGAIVKWVFLYESKNSDSVILGNVAFVEIKGHSLRTKHFLTKICNGSFEFLSALRKKVFPGAPVKCLFLYGLNIPDSVILGNAASE